MTNPFDPGYGPLIETRLRVATWNVWGRYHAWEARQPVILETLLTIDADVICLQEAWSDDERSQPAELADAMGFQHVYDPGFEMNGGMSGNAILSRWPIARHDVRELPMEGGGAVDTDVGERRLATFAEIDGPRGPLQAFSVHLSWRADWSGVRQAQVAELARVIASTRPRPFPPIVCGDFNAGADADEIRMVTGLAAVPVPGVVLRDAWAVAGDGSGWTIADTNPFSAANLEPNTRIDYVFTGWPKLGGAGQVLSARVAGDSPVDGLVGSDHYAVVAELRY
jgi:endonuclease/exonuclease/phosphatase family metal-dependent hydrolase